MSQLPDVLPDQPFYVENLAGAELCTIIRAADGLAVSADPAVVFASLARLCISLFCDACIVSIVHEDGSPFIGYWPQSDADAYRAKQRRERARATLADTGPQGAERPGAAAAGSGGDDSIFIPIIGDSARTGAEFGDPATEEPGSTGGYRGVFTLILQDRRPTSTHAVLARLLVERAISVVAAERLRQSAAGEAAQVANLKVALQSSRTVGMAIGVVVERHRLSPDQAFSLLCRISQADHRKVRELADEVVTTGELRIPAGVPLIRPERSPLPGPRRPDRRAQP